MPLLLADRCGSLSPVQCGTTIGVIGVYLVQQHLVPLARACEILQDLLGITMGGGTLCRLIERCAQNLASVETHIKEALVQAEVIHQDETVCTCSANVIGCM